MAAKLFVERGYVATSVADIAALAGVASKTIYLIFPSKRLLLDEVIGVALGGDDQPLRVLEREWAREILEAEPAQFAMLFARATTALHERSAALLEAADAAAGADPDLAARRDRGRQNRRADMRIMAESFAARSGADPTYVTDLLYTLGSASVYSLLVFQSGWSSAAYRDWLALMLAHSLSASPGGPRPQSGLE